MSWFAGARSNEDSVEYTAINYDLTDGGRDTLSETQARERTSSVSLAAPASGDQDARSNNKTKEQSYRILELSQAAGEEKPDSNTAPTIPGWPQGPRQLRGFSVLFLVGDILLICLPVAFLGTPLSIKKQIKRSLDVTTHSFGNLCVATGWGRAVRKGKNG